MNPAYITRACALSSRGARQGDVAICLYGLLLRADVEVRPYTRELALPYSKINLS